MKKHLRDNLAKFFYDGGRVSLAVLVIGLIARGPVSPFELIFGAVFTLIFLLFDVIIDLLTTKD